MSHHPSNKQVDLCAIWAAEVHADTAVPGRSGDKKTAAIHGGHPSRFNRWRTIGKGSPCYAALQYVLRLSAEEAMRVASAFLSAARMVALSGRSTDELIGMWWSLSRTEVTKESADRALSAMPPHSWEWAQKATAAERDASCELTIAAIERLFAHRKVSPTVVAAYQPAGRAS